MEKPSSSRQEQFERKKSIKRKFLVFSIALYLVIFIGGSIVFVLTMRQNAYINLGQELAREIEIERIKLETSVNSEIAIAIKMADSPLIQNYFINPYDTNLERIALEEIAAYRRAFAGNTVFWANDVDKYFWFDDTRASIIDPENPDEYWYKMTLYETELYNFNINYNPEIDKTNLWINAPVFGSNRMPIGIVGTGIDLTNFIDTIYRNYPGKAQIYFFNALNEVTGAQNASLVTNKVTLDNALGGLGNEIIAIARTLSSDEIYTFDTLEGKVAIGRIPALDWYIAAILPVNLIDVMAGSMTLVFLAMMGVIAFILFIVYLLMGWMLKPLNVMISTLDMISTSWDLTQKLKIRHQDETGILGDFFNLTFGKMRELITSIKGETAALSNTGEELTSHMAKTKNEIEGINDTIHGMREKVLSQADKVNATAGSVEQIIASLDSLNEHIMVQAENVAQSSSAIEEMLANIQSVTNTLVKNTGTIQSLSESSEAGRTDLQKVSNDINEISQESESLLQINSVMQTIASQTNLLAMNAAIEAAHAGESGKGFAVVADEIRKLAENSQSQSKTISAVLKKIKAMIDSITRSTNVLLERFSAIENEIHTVSDQETQIRNAMEEQGHGSRQILEAMTQLNSVTGLVRKASTGMTEDSKNVFSQSSDLKQITSDVAGSMDGISTSVDEIVTTISRVQDITKENKENINTLSRDISRFKVE